MAKPDAMSRSGGHRRPGIRWDRVGRAALLLVLATVLSLYISPVSRWITQSRTADAQRAELEELRSEHSHLVEQVRELRGPDAVEREARRLGMVREGERAFVVHGLP